MAGERHGFVIWKACGGDSGEVFWNQAAWLWVCHCDFGWTSLSLSSLSCTWNSWQEPPPLAMGKIRGGNVWKGLADSKSSNVIYHLKAKNTFTLWFEYVLALKIAPHSIYEPHSVGHSCMCDGPWELGGHQVLCGRCLPIPKARTGGWGTQRVSLLSFANRLRTWRSKTHYVSINLIETFLPSWMQWNELELMYFRKFLEFLS